MARSIDDPHKNLPVVGHDVPICQMGYWFSSDRGESCSEDVANTTQLTIVDCNSQYPLSLVCEKKGKDAYATANVIRFIEDMGYSDVRLQSDSEGSSTILSRQFTMRVARIWGGKPRCVWLLGTLIRAMALWKGQTVRFRSNRKLSVLTSKTSWVKTL